MPKLKPNQLCACGSGKKYRQCCAEKDHARRNVARQTKKIAKWGVGIGILALVLFGVSQMSNVAYTDVDIAVVDFTDLSQREKRTALEAANQARCPCGCGMTLAQCVATDSTCPLREPNIDKIRTMVQNARTSRTAS